MDSASSVSSATYTFMCVLFGVILGLASGGLAVALCVIYRLKMRLARYEGGPKNKRRVNVPRKALYSAMSRESGVNTRALSDILSIKGLDKLPQEKDEDQELQED